MSVILDDIERAIAQLFIAHKVLLKEDFDNYFNKLKEEFNSQEIKSTDDIFKRINSNLSNFSLEIRTLYVNEENKRSYYHGLVNTVNDWAAVPVGTDFTESEITFFREIALSLIEKDKLNLNDVFKLNRPQSFDKATVEDLLNKFTKEHWITKNEYNYYILAPRSYLELRSFFESHISDKSLPQVLIY